MAIANVSRPSSTLTNTDRVASFETWAAIATTWASETRTWLDCSSLLDNTSRASSSISNLAKP